MRREGKNNHKRNICETFHRTHFTKVVYHTLVKVFSLLNRIVVMVVDTSRQGFKL